MRLQSSAVSHSFLADRIIPLSAGPNATLGPEVAVDIERPRDRKALNHDPRFKEIRKAVLDYLLGEGGRPKSEVSRRLILPNIEPEDVSNRRFLTPRRGPVRRNERTRETVEIS